MNKEEKYLTNVIFIKLSGKAIFIPTNKISHIILEGKHCKLFVEEEILEVKSSLKQIEASINNKAFIKVYKTTLINLNYLKEIYLKDKLVLLTNGTRLLISSKYLDKLIKMYPTFS